ncbi:ABC transporter permease subunit [Roseomonas xinghualingensis]|uniref:ABC transporter permease subunit n=1 Tax=Roseomonas xinghualingensis TaxID=2986475 RepID=UPI0021F221F3|nr:ABC transporter permease subunit [Roseomonas sp. SXEYE001]MCV4210130.1 ABC transporter permease subunit [Roseomonas sp. SXEYE001]
MRQLGRLPCASLSDHPSAAPQVMETLRLMLRWAWTYVIVAELIGATSGSGRMIMDSQRLRGTGQMIVRIMVIWLIGLVTDFLLKAPNRRLFPWAML